jgi:proteasome lid subunit RPN8/RPN11
VVTYLQYDDVSPTARSADYVVLLGNDMSKVWLECERQGLQVVADVHTHPAGPVQSRSDRANPIVSITGHIALIVPNFATGRVRPQDLGVHEFLGCGRWQSWFGEDAASRLHFS